MKKNFSIKGVTMIELMMALAIFSVGVTGAIYFLRRAVTTWHAFSKQTGIQQQARTAIQEMQYYLRESSSPASLTLPVVGSTSSVQMEVMTTESAAAKSVKFYKSGEKLFRVINGSTSTLIYSHLREIYFVHESSFVMRIDSLTLTDGPRTVRLNSKVFMRNK